MSDVKLGTLIDGTGARDAIHIAVAPVTSDDELDPGQHVALVTGTTDKVQATGGDKIGIVDPFLREPVQPGQRFWLLLYPQTITGLRHEWSHPAFVAAATQSAEDKHVSEQWLKEYVRVHCPYWDKHPDAVETFLSYVREERWIYYAGTACHSIADVDNPDELFFHLSVVLGIKITAEYFREFTCSC